MKKIFRLGTRGSALALVQAQIVRDLLILSHSEQPLSFDIEIVPIRTSGDWVPTTGEKTFLDMGTTKGLFTKEIEEALDHDVIDFAVHSLKDVSVDIDPRFTLSTFLKREDSRDAFLSSNARCLEELPQGAKVGTSSLRRKAQLLARRPDLSVVPLRGNVDTRLRKLEAEEVDATILAVAGLSRLNLMNAIASVMSVNDMLPAAAQGCLALQTKAENEEVISWLSVINDRTTELCCLAERALLRKLDGSCRTPIAAYATVDETETLVLEALVAKPDGSMVVRRQARGSSREAEEIGKCLGEEIKGLAPPGLLDIKP